jgi:short-subunit dehydrogenase
MPENSDQNLPVVTQPDLLQSTTPPPFNPDPETKAAIPEGLPATSPQAVQEESRPQERSLREQAFEESHPEEQAPQAPTPQEQPVCETPPPPPHKLFAVVTGGSSGIGFELAKQLAFHGYDLLIVASSDTIEARANELRAMGTNTESMAVDLASFSGVEQLCEKIQSMGRPIDVLCLNAGVGVGGRFVETNLDDELNMVALNVLGAVHLTKKVLPQMLHQGSGHILITSSIAAVMPSPFEAVYGATKAFLLLFSESLASELKDTDVKVTAVLPGPTDTNFFHRANMTDTKAGQDRKDSPAQVAEQAYHAMVEGKQKAYVGSFKNRVMGMLADLLPDEIGAENHRKLSEPGSGTRASVH